MQSFIKISIQLCSQEPMCEILCKHSDWTHNRIESLFEYSILNSFSWFSKQNVHSTISYWAKIVISYSEIFAFITFLVHHDEKHSKPCNKKVHTALPSTHFNNYHENSAFHSYFHQYLLARFRLKFWYLLLFHQLHLINVRPLNKTKVILFRCDYALYILARFYPKCNAIASSNTFYPLSSSLNANQTFSYSSIISNILHPTKFWWLFHCYFVVLLDHQAMYATRYKFRD